LKEFCFEEMMMSGGRMYGGPNVLVMGNENISRSADALEALLSSPVFNGSRSVANLEEVIGNVSKRPFYNSFDQEETGDEDLDDCIHPPEKKRRLTADQVQFLERSFEIENKLEPERKIQLAKDLGLQPRQVAVWFQNRRARWKTKQLERDYDILKSRYENLRVDYDSLLKEKDKLRAEVTFLTGKLHSKDCDLEAQTKDSEYVDKKVFPQPASQCVEKFERGTSIKDTPPSCKHEDLLSSGTDSSGVLDEDSPHHVDCGHSSLDHVNSHLFEADQSDLSHADEEEEEEGMSEKLLPQTYTYHLLKVEDGPYPDASIASYNEMFAMEDQVPLGPWWD
jgi:homeobox-leucine zipper protein